MKGITIRFGDTTYNMLKTEAAHEGISLTTFIREAAYGRAILLAARRGAYGEKDDALIQAVRNHLAARER